MSDATDLIPVLACSDIAAEHDFLVEVLGFESAGLDRSPDGVVQHGEVRWSSRRIWLHRTSEEHQLAPPGALGTANGGMVVHVPDVDAHHARVSSLAATSGAEIMSEPTDQEYGQREYGVRDPDGHHWWFATPTTSPAAR